MAIRSAGIERCADIEIEIISGPGTTPGCGEQRAINRSFWVINNGPDEARDVVLSIVETSDKAPGFALYAPGCSGLQCTWPSIPAGVRKDVLGLSDLFANDKVLEHGVKVSIRTVDSDPIPENDVRTVSGAVQPFTGGCGLPDYGADSSSDSGVSACFIATAAYGTPFEDRIDKLRHFRDHTLARFEAGRAFTHWYYLHSPPIAEYIESRPALQALVRALLEPTLLVISYPATALAFPMLILLLLILRRRIF